MVAFVAAPAAAAGGLTAARGGAFTAAARPATAAAAAAPARRAVVRMYGPPASAGSSTERSAKLTDPERRPGSLKGFVNEMRMVAMRLHTKDQAKEGMQEKSTIPINEWKYVGGGSGRYCCCRVRPWGGVGTAQSRGEMLWLRCFCR